MSANGQLSRVFLSGVSYRHGAWNDLAKLAADGVAEQTIQSLAAGGLTRFSRMSGPPKSHYHGCVTDTLRATGLDPRDIDAVLFTSSTFSPHDDYDDIAELCDRTGLRPSFPLGTFLGQCTNFSIAAKTAEALVRSDGLRNVLVLGADVLNEKRISRVLAREVSVFSDTVASVIVGRHERGYQIDSIAHVFQPDLHRLDPERDVLELVNRFSVALGDACDAAFRSAACTPDEVSRLILPNLTQPVLRNYAAVSKVSYKRAFTDNIGRFGHCFAYDQLLALATLDDQGATSAGDRLLLIGVGGNYLFSACCLRRV